MKKGYFKNKTVFAYDEANTLIGFIEEETDKKDIEFVIGKSRYKLIRKGSRRKELIADGKTERRFRFNGFLTHVFELESQRRYTGFYGFKHGSRMVDKENKTLIEVRNANTFLDTQKYMIDTDCSDASKLDVLLVTSSHIMY